MNRQEYIDRWNEHIDVLYTLAFCENVEHHDQVVDCIKTLKMLVPQIASTKTNLTVEVRA